MASKFVTLHLVQDLGYAPISFCFSQTFNQRRGGMCLLQSLRETLIYRPCRSSNAALEAL